MTATTAPPRLEGFTYVDHVGRGGFADVYVYEQARPRRKVAVKVLKEAALSEQAIAQFTAEADLMASLSAHRNIVSIYSADVAPDGRPYLVMELYPPPNLAERVRTAPLPVDEVLRIGVMVASAVETAHRADIVHRDIKPANILVNAFGDPALTDFGLSVNRTAVPSDDEGGMSVPWAAPEVVSGADRGDVRSDVWSLGATLWHLLAGRSPFVAPGGDNRPIALMRRIEREPLPAIGRQDVPPSLEKALARTMAKRPDLRTATAIELARALQQVQQELHLPMTREEVPDLREAVWSALRPDDPEIGVTVRKPSVPIVQAPPAPPAPPPAFAPSAVPQPAPPADANRVWTPPVMPAAPPTAGDTAPTVRPAATQGAPVSWSPAPVDLPPGAGSDVRGVPADDVPMTVRRPLVPQPVEPPPPAAPASRRALAVGAGAVLLAAAGVTVAVVLAGGGGGDQDAPSGAPATFSASPQDGVVATPPAVTGTGSRPGPAEARFRWSVDDPAAVTGYLVTRTDDGQGARVSDEVVRGTTFRVTGLRRSDRPCLEVRAVGEAGATGRPVRICAPAG